MSGREDRSSESKRRRSRFDRETSHKRSRRDGKPESERPPAVSELETDREEQDHRHRRRLQDPLPLESGNMSRESGKRGGEDKETARHSSDPTKIPQLRSYLQQHDGRGSADPNGRGFSRRTENERGWWRDSKEQRNDRSINKTASVDAQLKDEKSKDHREINRHWRHDGHFETEANAKLPACKRPSFTEQKITTDPERTDKAVDDPLMPNPQPHAMNSGRRNGRDHNSRYSRRPVAGDRELNKAQSWRGNFPAGDRSSTGHRGGDRFTAKQSYHPTGGRVEKWKHDLYHEANKSPPQKNEEDQISKIEALLTS